VHRATERDVLDVLERFCSGLADHDANAVMRLVADDADLVVVTSEEPLLRGPEELRQFLDRYAAGPTTYSWDWGRRDVTIADPFAWLLAEGTETVTSGDHVERHPYRMTIVFERREHRWVVRMAHGSSPS
jgi:uncharacterized protein (TIGR02246 family)